MLNDSVYLPSTAKYKTGENKMLINSKIDCE